MEQERRIWSVRSCQPGTSQSAAATIGLVFVGALSAFFGRTGSTPTPLNIRGHNHETQDSFVSRRDQSANNACHHGGHGCVASVSPRVSYRTTNPRKRAARVDGLRPGRTRCSLRSSPLRSAQSEILKRLASNSAMVRARLGQPQRESDGPTDVEKLDIYRTQRATAPVFVFIHGGAWLGGEANDYAYPAELFVNAGAHYVALDFIAIEKAGVISG